MTLLQAAPTPDPSTGDFWNLILGAIQHREWSLIAALGVIAVVAMLRWLAPKLHDSFGAWLNTQRGGAVLAILGGCAGSVATALVAGQHMTLQMLTSGFGVGLMAIGGWNAFWDLFMPKDAGKKPSQPDVAGKIELPPPIRPGVFLPFLLIGTMFLAGCACSKPENKYSPVCKVLNVVVACGGQAVEAGLIAIIEGALPAVTGAVIDWGAIATLEEKYGTDAVMCALAKASNLANSRGDAPKGMKLESHQLLISAKDNVTKNVKEILAKRHVVIQGGGV